MSIGSTLKLLRTASNLKQSSLAKDLDITANYLSLIENGRKEPSLTFLKRFAKEMDTPLGYLIWLALDENRSQEEIVLKRKMNELLMNIIRAKGEKSETDQGGDEEKEKT